MTLPNLNIIEYHYDENNLVMLRMSAEILRYPKEHSPFSSAHEVSEVNKVKFCSKI